MAIVKGGYTSFTPDCGEMGSTTPGAINAASANCAAHMHFPFLGMVLHDIVSHLHGLRAVGSNRGHHMTV